jgi:hypothetical protein
MKHTDTTAFLLAFFSLGLLLTSAGSLELNNYITSFVTGVTGIISAVKAVQIWDQLQKENN